MSKADGSVRIDTTLNTDGVKKGTEEIKEELESLDDNTQKASESVGGDLASGFKKLGKAIVAAGVVDMLVDFGKQAIELGSDLEEVQNVVDVTFKTMSDEVNKFAKDAQKAAGLSEKMAKQYVGTFGAMADSFGFAEEEAYEMSTTLTQLVGDVASFYNLSQDEAMNKLKGVFTGETEALKELGVVMTQAALDNYALANGFDKTTASMTEQEKVALRYQFVMDQLAASSGDFVRTQDSWANQSKILALQWESLMATLGSGLIDVLTPGIQFLNEKVLPALDAMAEKFAEAMEPKPSKELEKSLKSAAEAAEDAEKQYKKTAEQVETNAIAAQHYKARLEELEKANMQSTETQIAYKSVVDQLNELYPELNLKISEQTGLIDDNSRAQLANLDVQKQKYLMMAVEEQLTAIYEAQGQAQAALYKAMADREAVTNRLAAAEEQLLATTSMSLDEMMLLYNQTQMGNGIFEELDGTVKELTSDQLKLLNEIVDLKEEENKLNKTIETGQKDIDAYDKELNDLRKTYGLAEEEAGDFAQIQKDVSQSVEETKTELEELKSAYDDAKQASENSIRTQVGLFDELKLKSDTSSAQIIKNWESQRLAFDNYKANLEKAIDMGLDEALVKQLADGSTESMAILNEFVNNTEVSVDDINEAFRKTEESKETVSATMADIQTEMSQKLDAIAKTSSNEWGNMADDVQREITRMQMYINNLKGKSVTLEIKTKSGSTSGRDVSLSNPSLGGYSLRSTDVPYLASGAVIPPNAPFLAMLGDQKRGTNIEAPLSTIQEAVSNVVEGAILSGFAAMIKEQQATQEILKNIEIGDTIIGQAVDRYNEMNNIIRGGGL